MPRPLLPLLAVLLSVAAPLPAWAVEPWWSVKARAELGDAPRLESGPASVLGALGALGLAQTQLMGRLPTVEVRVGQAITSNLDVQLSGAVRQDLTMPLANPELFDAYRQRVLWRQGGGVGLNPLYVAQVEDAFVEVTDPVRNGGIRVGQFLVPWGWDDYVAVDPSVALAPVESPMTEFLSATGTGVYQSSTLTRWRDIGATLTGDAGGMPYTVGVFNGSGPNRLDDNGAKDWFARLDWAPSPTDRLGVSVLFGDDQVFPRGFQDPGVAVARRRWGVHWRFKLADVGVQGEWAREQRLNLDPEPRDGYTIQFSQLMGGSDLFYVTYGQYDDPAARPGGGYLVRETIMGDVRPVMPGISWRIEGTYRWEFSDPQSTQYARVLTGVEAAIGGPKVATETTPYGGMPTIP